MAFNTRSVSAHQFSMIPRADIPRASFRIQTTHKTTFDSGLLIPVYVDEVLPGDHFKLKMTAFARMATPIFPIMDNAYMDSFFFYVPYRLLWNNWQKFMGEQDNPGDSTDYLLPKITSPVSGYAANSIFDYMGLPTVGQVTGGSTVTHNVLPLRAYNLIYKEWFRDENLISSPVINKGDGPDVSTDYSLRRRGKRHDYFTSALPWPQKGNSVTLPLGASAPVLTSSSRQVSGTQQPMNLAIASGGAFPGTTMGLGHASTTGALTQSTAAMTGTSNTFYPANLYADLSSATAATINQIRQAFQVQRLLERDARGGTRYTEILRSHFGVISPDARLQRPEYLGGGTSQVNISPIAQTSGSNITGGTTPLGNLAAIGTLVQSGGRNGFSQGFVEHGVVIGLVCVRADLNYQQGLRKMWSRSTRYDLYFPVFAHLGEQAVLNKEIYVTGTATDDQVFGYQERWAEYRYHPSLITGLFKSTSAGTIDGWHLAQRFTALPVLNQAFIEETPPFQRVLAVGAAAAGKEFIFDSFFDISASRPMPLYSVPGLIDHF